MNEQMLEQRSEEVLMVEVSDEALEAAGGNDLGGPTYTAPTAYPCSLICR